MILVAGIGNIFYRDDGFGVSVAQRLAQRTLPPNVRVGDFGIRGIDLVFALLDAPELTILVDTVARGGAPGTLYTLEPDMANIVAEEPDDVLLDTHRLDPVAVLRSAAMMGAKLNRVLLVGCEPRETGQDDDGGIGLSEAVEAAVEPAIETILALVEEVEVHERTAVL